jgi:hypothetical protein
MGGYSLGVQKVPILHNCLFGESKMTMLKRGEIMRVGAAATVGIGLGLYFWLPGLMIASAVLLGMAFVSEYQLNRQERDDHR